MKQSKLKEKALFAGCLVTCRFPEYELSSKRVLETIGIKTHTIPGATCCGQVLQGVNPNWLYMTAYNLARAEKLNLDLITLCGGCTNTFKRVQFMCRQNPDLLKDINRVLNKLGLQFNNSVKVQHLLEVMYDNREAMPGKKKQLPVKVAVMNPCQVFRPVEIMQFDNAKHPRVMENLLGPIVSEIVPYPMQDDCCGASMTMICRETAFKIGGLRLEQLQNQQADLIATACGNCHLLLHNLQSEYYRGQRIPCLFLPQLLGVAWGLDWQDVMINDRQIRSLVGGV